MIDEARSMGWVESIQRVPNASQRDQIYPEVLKNYRQKDQPVSPVEAASESKFQSGWCWWLELWEELEDGRS